jgi:hypothetical protein
MTSQQRQVKQILIAITYAIICSTIVFVLVITFFPKVPAPTIVEQPKPIALQITQYNSISLGNGYSDFWAEINNPNDNFGAKSLDYTFILKSATGEIQRKTGNTFILPGDKKRYILLLNYPGNYTLEGFELSDTPVWTQLSRFNLPELSIRNKSLGVSEKAGNAFTAFGTLTNTSEFNLKNIQVIAILSDNGGNIIGVNETLIRDILKAESRDFELTWNSIIPNATVANTTILPQSNVLDTGELLIQLQQKPVFDR